jgi:trehalose utilization protein
VFAGWFRGGELFRSGCCWNRGTGKVFYFQPGHETNRSFHNPHVQRIIRNAVHWAAPIRHRSTLGCLYMGQTTEALAAEGLPIDQY